MTEAVEPSPYQAAILLAPADVDTLVLAGGRGGGKSFAAAFYLLRHAITYGADSKQLYLRKSFPQLRDFEAICEALFKQAVPGAEFNRHERIWRFPNGAQIEISQYESRAMSYERLVGRSFATVIVDEAGTYNALDDIDVLRSNIRARKGVACRLMLLANPNGPLHGAILRRYIAGVAPWTPTLDKVSGTQFILCPSTYRLNPFLDQQKYETTLRAAAANDPQRLAAWLEGDWSGSVSGLYLDGVDFDKVKVAPMLGCPVSFKPFICGDYGSYYPSWFGLFLKARRNTALPCGRSIAKGSVVLIDEAHSATDHDLNLGRGLNVEDQAALVVRMCERHGVRQWGFLDDACFNRSGGPGTPSTADLFLRSGVRFQKAHKGGRLASMENFRHALFAASGDAEPAFYASSGLLYWWNTVPLLVRSEKHPDEIADHQAAHAFDASRYALTAGEAARVVQRGWNEQPRAATREDDRVGARYV